MAKTGGTFSGWQREPGAPAPVERVMVVDDDPFVRTVTADALISAGAVVATCASGEEAIAAAQDFQPTLVILDLHMPGINGPETWTILRARLSPTPNFILLTAEDDPAARDKIMGLGAVGVIVKPFDPATVVGTMRQLMGSDMARLPSARLETIAADFRLSLGVTADAIDGAWSRLSSSDWRGQVEVILARAHMLAGSAGLFQFNAIGSSADRLECILAELLKGDQPLAASDLSEVEKAVVGLTAACRAAALSKAS